MFEDDELIPYLKTTLNHTSVRRASHPELLDRLTLPPVLFRRSLELGRQYPAQPQQE
jgi:hypothetical protein